MSDLIGEIRSARQLLREEESRTHDAAIELQNCKQRERKARGELDALLDALEGGEALSAAPRGRRWQRPGLDPDCRGLHGTAAGPGQGERRGPLSTITRPRSVAPVPVRRLDLVELRSAWPRSRSATPSWACC